MASSTIGNSKGWTLRDTYTFTAVTVVSRNISIPKGSYSEVLIVGGNMVAVIPMVDGVTSYSVTSYNSYAGYGMRLQCGINTSNDNALVFSARLEEKLQNTGYPTLRLYTR